MINFVHEANSTFFSPVEASQKLKQASTTSVCGTENPNGTFNSPPYTPMTSIEEWLQHINMDHCVPNLKKGQDKNYMTIGDVIHIGMFNCLLASFSFLEPKFLGDMRRKFIRKLEEKN